MYVNYFTIGRGKGKKKSFKKKFEGVKGRHEGTDFYMS